MQHWNAEAAGCWTIPTRKDRPGMYLHIPVTCYIFDIDDAGICTPPITRADLQLLQGPGIYKLRNFFKQNESITSSVDPKHTAAFLLSPL